MTSETWPLLAAKLKLRNDVTIPQIQLGLYMMTSKEAKQAVKIGLEAGYRAFDCAQMYGSEREAGGAISQFLATTQAVRRHDIFYTSKLASNSTDYDTVRRSVKKSVDACGLGYIDLFLLHSPYGGREARLTSWRALEDAVDAGQVRTIGVSNYGVAHIEELMALNPRIKPAINQIEVHPFNTQEAIRAACARYEIQIEAYAPLARAMRMTHSAVVEMSGRYACTPAQLLIKWSLQHGMVTLPKSVRRERMIENAAVSGFDIDPADMQILDGLDEKLVTDWDPTNAP